MQPSSLVSSESSYEMENRAQLIIIISVCLLLTQCLSTIHNGCGKIFGHLGFITSEVLLKAVLVGWRAQLKLIQLSLHKKQFLYNTVEHRAQETWVLCVILSEEEKHEGPSCS